MQIDSKPGQPFRAYEVKVLRDASTDGSQHNGKAEDPHALSVRMSTDVTTATGQRGPSAESARRKLQILIVNK